MEKYCGLVAFLLHYLCIDICSRKHDGYDDGAERMPAEISEETQTAKN